MTGFTDLLMRVFGPGPRDIYGAMWLESHEQEMREKWKVEFRRAADGEMFVGFDMLTYEYSSRYHGEQPRFVIVGDPEPEKLRARVKKLLTATVLR